jgi:beta-galactosidase
VSTFEIGDEHFLLDGKPHRVMAGALHYFRVHPDHWADRIHKAKLMGLNAIETYVPWNAHSPRPGEFRTEGQLDLVAFLELVHAEGMHAIVRPGPYICAEWDNGGLPGWLFLDAEVGIRRNEPLYMAAVARYFDDVLPLIAPLQIDRGGPVILMQVENEYGAYGSDKDYLRELVRLTRAGGITVPLTSIDQPTDAMLADGSIDELHKTGSFGSRSVERLATLRRHQPTGPLMCAEYWNGWFDHWGAHHHATSVDEVESDFRELMATGASFTLYMFHGGTNFGFTNGANDKGTYQATVTSYDYDAPLAEDGRPTAKYHAFRRVISEFESVPIDVPDPTVEAPAFTVGLNRTAPLSDLVDDLDAWQHSVSVPTADTLGHFDGFVLYRAQLAASPSRVLAIGEVRDRAQVRLDGMPVGTLSRASHEGTLALPGGDSATLELLVEDQGRVNYGPRIGEPKGVIGPVLVNDSVVEGWDALALNSDALRDLQARSLDAGHALDGREPVAGPAFVSGAFVLEAASDLFLSTVGWGKGVAWINGFNLGRYWSAGPQSTLYVPAGVVRPGSNWVVLLELQAARASVIEFVPSARLGSTEF